MCLGHGSLASPPLCGLAEEVFAALPWPCAVWNRQGARAVMVNGAFLREFGIGRGRAGPAWIENHLEPTDQPDEVVFRDRHAPARRYRMSRQPIDLPDGGFEAVFLVPVPEDEPLAAAVSVEPPESNFASLRPDVGLTPRESQVLDGIMNGKLNKVIASELQISPKTVELHRANLMAKLRVHNVIELARAVLDGPPPRAEGPALAADAVRAAGLP
jgi:DNA-binding CsgD family transcriptional regulator